MESLSPWQILRSWGVLRGLHAAVMYSLRRRFKLCWVMVRPGLPADAAPSLAPTREARIASPEELIAAAADPLNDLNAQWIKKAHERGELCAAVFEEGKLLSYTWRAFAPTPHEMGLEVHFDPRYVYAFYAYTQPDYRRQGLQNAADFYSDQYLVSLGYREGIGFIETHNYPSLVAQRKRGARRVGLAGYLYLCGRVYTFRTPGAKRHGFAFFPAQSTAASEPATEFAQAASTDS